MRNKDRILASGESVDVWASKNDALMGLTSPENYAYYGAELDYKVTPMMTAAVKGDLEGMKQLYEADLIANGLNGTRRSDVKNQPGYYDMSIFQRDWFCNSAIGITARYGNLEAYKWLVSIGFDPASGEDGCTNAFNTFLLAAKNAEKDEEGNSEGIKIMRYIDSLNSTLKYGRGITENESAILLAAQYSSVEINKFLIEEMDQNVNDTSHPLVRQGRNLFNMALEGKNLEVMEYYHSIAPYLAHELDYNGCNALNVASWYSDISIVKYLVEELELDVNHRCGYTLQRNNFLLALQAGHIQGFTRATVLKNLKYFDKLNPEWKNEVDNSGAGALEVCAQFGDVTSMKYLIVEKKINPDSLWTGASSQGQDINKQCNCNPFMLAVAGANEEMMSYLNEYDPSFKNGTLYGSDIFTAAVQRGDTKTFEGVKKSLQNDQN